MRAAGVLALAAATLFAAPAYATGEISCTAEGDAASVDMEVGRLEFLTILSATIRIGSETWSTAEGGEGTRIVVGQAFEDERQLMVDFADSNVEGVVGRLRAFSLADGDDWKSGGVFSMKGKGTFIVDCSLRG